MNQTLKKWLLSGIVFFLSTIVMIVITLALAFVSILYEYIIFPVMCILAGYIIMKILNKIDALMIPATVPPTTPGLTSTHTWIFAIYTTIITSIVAEIAHIIAKFNENMALFNQSVVSSGSSGTGIGVASIFGTVHPIYTMIVSFVGLNLAYGYFYFKNPDKHWKDIIPHLCGIMIVIALYAMNLSRFITG